MDLKIPYSKVADQQNAFKIVQEFLVSDGLASLPVKPEFEFIPEKNLIIAKGSGFTIKANFEVTQVLISLELSFLYKAFKGKIKDLLEHKLRSRL